MGNFLARAYDKISTVANHTPLSADEKLRLQHYTIFLVLGAPTMMAFAVLSLLRGDVPLGGSVTASVSGLCLGWLLIRRGLRPVVIYRTNVLLFLSLIVFIAAVGGDNGSKILWSYIFPLTAFFLFGRREGWFWTGLSYVLLAVVLFERIDSLPTYDYPLQFQIRFLITYAFVGIMSFGFEYLREENRAKLECERIRLESALAEVKALSGLLPICSSCKKIRDDRGYWNQLESYIHSHSEVRFSHGICPDCAHELYPDMDLEEEADGERI